MNFSDPRIVSNCIEYMKKISDRPHRNFVDRHHGRDSRNEPTTIHSSVALMIAAGLTGEDPLTWGVFQGDDASDECLEGDYPFLEEDANAGLTK